jgi:hypothetical protein
MVATQSCRTTSGVYGKPVISIFIHLWCYRLLCISWICRFLLNASVCHRKHLKTEPTVLRVWIASVCNGLWEKKTNLAHLSDFRTPIPWLQSQQTFPLCLLPLHPQIDLIDFSSHQSTDCPSHRTQSGDNDQWTIESKDRGENKCTVELTEMLSTRAYVARV